MILFKDNESLSENQSDEFEPPSKRIKIMLEVESIKYEGFLYQSQ